MSPTAPTSIEEELPSINDSAHELRLPALKVMQGHDRVLYAFAVDGKQLTDFTTVSRIKRPDGSGVLGYQRPEIQSHVTEIRRYLESSAPMIPNAIVIAFDQRVRFEALDSVTANGDFSTHGFLVIPITTSDAPEDKPGWVVDGQQRLAAIREADISSFPICAVGFVAPDTREQREQFMLVNSTKPLQKSLIYELLPDTSTRLPALLEKRRLPARICERLNHDVDSPLYGKIQVSTNPSGLIKDNSVLKMLENSLSEGVLYRYRRSDGEVDLDSMLRVLKEYWRAVAAVFWDSWDLPPRRSRLMHGVGVIALGHLMDAICDRYRREGDVSFAHFQEDLSAMQQFCCWTSGHWEFGPGQVRKWNELQNTSKDIQLLTNYLLAQYRQKIWVRGSL